MPIELTTATDTQKTNIRDALAAAKDVAFVGAAADAIGQKGIVPQPQIGDQDKYLRGNGTWSGFGAIPAIGGVTPNSGAFTSLSASGNTTVGGTLQVTGLVTGTAGFSGSLTGNVTGDVAGNLNGQVGNTTPNTGAFTTLSANNGTITTSSPAFTLAQTWNAAGATFTALRVNVTDTASAAGSLLMDLQVGGSSVFKIIKGAETTDTPQNGSGLFVQSGNNSFVIRTAASNTNAFLHTQNGGGTFSFGMPNGNGHIRLNGANMLEFRSTIVSCLQNLGIGATDTILTRDAANVLAQRNSTNAQTFRLYNTFTDASNYERASIGWTSNTFVISPEKAGTGSIRNAKYFLGHNGSSMTSFIEGYGTNGVNIAAGGANFVWFFNTGSLTNEYAFGGDVIIGGRQVGGGNSNFSSPRLKLQGGAGTGSGTGGEVWAEGSLTRASGTTQHTVYELFRGYITSADQPMFSIGGKTSSFPALKRSSAVLQARLADDSGYTVLDAQLRAQGTAPATAGATGTAGDIRYDADYIYICTATNTWKRVAIATWP